MAPPRAEHPIEVRRTPGGAGQDAVCGPRSPARRCANGVQINLEPEPGISAWDTGILGPIANAERRWHKRAVRIDRIRAFPQQIVLTLRAGKKQDLAWALDALRDDPFMKERSLTGVAWMHRCPPIAKGEAFQVDALIDVRGFQAFKHRRGLKTAGTARSQRSVAQKVAEAAKPASLKVEVVSTRTHEASGQVYDVHVFAAESGSAAQILTLLHNVAAWLDLGIGSATWDGPLEPKGKPETVGTAVFEVMRLRRP